MGYDENVLRPAPPEPRHWAELRAAENRPETKWYRVVGDRAVFGIEPGTVGQLTMTESQRVSLIEAGHVVEADEPKPEPVSEAEPEHPARKPRRRAAQADETSRE